MWRNDAKRPAHDRPKIKRRIENAHPFRRSFLRQGMTGCRGGSEDALQIRPERAQLVGQFQCDHNFTDADRMNPRRMLTAQTFARRSRIEPEALPEVSAVAAAAKHFREISGQKQQKPNRPQQIVD